MAGEWIKMRTNLWDDPRIARLCDLTDQSEAAVIGGLYWLWAMADEHTEDGILPGLTTKAIDRKTGVSGLGQALCTIGWLQSTDEGVCILGFEEHNGASAKKRATTAKRVASHRSNADETPAADDGNAQVTLAALQDDQVSVTPALAREEKIREEVNTTSSLRSEVGAVAPRKRGARLVPDSFDVTPEMQAWARATHPSVDLQTQTAAFRDHEFKDSKTDWVKAWRNWIRRAAQPMARGSPQRETPYAQHMRERVAQAAGSMAHIVAAKPPGTAPHQRPREPWEVAADEQRTIENGYPGTLAIGVD